MAPKVFEFHLLKLPGYSTAKLRKVLHGSYARHTKCAVYAELLRRKRNQ